MSDCDMVAMESYMSQPQFCKGTEGCELNNNIDLDSVECKRCIKEAKNNKYL